MSKIFLSYRRADSQDVTGRIYDALLPVFGKENIFRDLDSIRGGVDFRTSIQQALQECRVTLVIIGSIWLSVSDQAGRRRLDDPGDFVRLEVEQSLAQGHVYVFPLLVGGAAMPDARQLPGSLAQLVNQNARPVRSDPDFHHDMERVVQEIRYIIPAPKRGSAEAENGTRALQQKNYALAIRYLAQAQELDPNDGAVAFKYALALLQGRSPGSLREKGDIVRVEELLRVAMLALKVKEIIAFWGVVKEDYWFQRWSYDKEYRDALALYQLARSCPSDRTLFGLLSVVQPDVMVRFADRFR